jgi:hypothetical protein
MGLLLGWFERSRFRIRRVGVSRRWFSGRNDHTSLGSRDDDGALRIGQLRRDADYRGVVDAINKARIMHTRNIQRVPPSAALVVIANIKRSRQRELRNRTNCGLTTCPAGTKRSISMVRDSPRGLTGPNVKSARPEKHAAPPPLFGLLTCIKSGRSDSDKIGIVNCAGLAILRRLVERRRCKKYRCSMRRTSRHLL